MAMSFRQLQDQLAQVFNQIQSMAVELASVNTKVELLNIDRVAKDLIIRELRDASRQLIDMVQRSTAGRGGIDMKSMNPKKFDGKAESPFKAWVKSVRAYCNASRPGFRKFLRWIENQREVIDYVVLPHCDWMPKGIANQALYEFLLMHTSDDAQQLV